ncbi:MAG: DUF4153 domain-containing protein [Gemmatimonadales bacterium]
MRFPSFVTLADRAREVVLRFPWTIAAGVFAATAAIIGTTHSGRHEEWVRIAAVAGLGLPLTVALTLFAEERGWSSGRKAALNMAGIALLALFYLAWPGPEPKHEAIRYFQFSMGLHLLAATLPVLGQRETNAFWQYNRHLFLGFLRATVFSFVLYIGLVIALLALDKLFGVDVPAELYGRLYLVVVFVINTGIFLAAVPRGLRELAGDTSYPRVLKVFAQYILTPLVFTYLLILLAYLVKIVGGGEWPSGWIGWLVSSVAVAGLLGFLLVHPLRNDAGEAWIRTYTRWLFIGLIPAAVVLLVAFWKRVLPYGLTEPRLLGVLLGFWLLAIAVSYTMRQGAGIRRIPVTLGALLLVTLYGPLSVTSLSVSSQSRRLTRLVSAHQKGQHTDQEVSAALRFLLDHGARRQVIAAIPAELPRVPWDSVTRNASTRDEAARRILAAAGMRYLPEYASTRGEYLYLNAKEEPVVSIRGYEYMLNLSGDSVAPFVAGPDSVRSWFDTASDVLYVSVGTDSLRFDLGRLADTLAAEQSTSFPNLPAERLRLEVTTRSRKARLALQWLNGRRTPNSMNVDRWNGKLFLGKP